MVRGLEKWCIGEDWENWYCSALRRQLQEDLTAVAHMEEFARFFSDVHSDKLRGNGHILLSSAWIQRFIYFSFLISFSLSVSLSLFLFLSVFLSIMKVVKYRKKLPREACDLLPGRYPVCLNMFLISLGWAVGCPRWPPEAHCNLWVLAS